MLGPFVFTVVERIDPYRISTPCGDFTSQCLQNLFTRFSIPARKRPTLSHLHITKTACMVCKHVFLMWRWRESNPRPRRCIRATLQRIDRLKDLSGHCQKRSTISERRVSRIQDVMETTQHPRTRVILHRARHIGCQTKRCRASRAVTLERRRGPHR